MADIIKNCEYCKKDFVISHRLKSKVWKIRFCSISCSGKGQSKKVKKQCPECKIEFWVKPSHESIRKYCSKKCMDVRRNEITRNCIICSTEFKFYNQEKAAGKYCSQKCNGISRTKPRKIKQCLVCTKDFTPDISYECKKYCSIECYASTMVGIEKPSFWETASEEEKLQRLRDSYEKYVIRQDGCWGWSGNLCKKYGSLQFGLNKKSITAHRASYLLHKGKIPTKLFVCHTCDNPPCTNPDHLFLGTPTDNVRDMHKKGRQIIQRGEDVGGSKLTWEQVDSIRKSLSEGVTYQELATKYSVALVTIHDIKHGLTWTKKTGK